MSVLLARLVPIVRRHRCALVAALFGASAIAFMAYQRYSTRRPSEQQTPQMNATKQGFEATPNTALIIIDPPSDVCTFMSSLRENGRNVIIVTSHRYTQAHTTRSNTDQLHHSDNVIAHFFQRKADTNVADLLTEIRSTVVGIGGVIIGSPSGLVLGEMLSDALSLHSHNSPSTSTLRMNQFAMQERLRSLKLNAIQTIHATSWQEVTVFIHPSQLSHAHHNAINVVIKLVDQVESNRVDCVRTFVELKKHFEQILQSAKNTFGDHHRAVIVQPLMSGDEYVIDTVSLKNCHKVTALWRLHKRNVNGAPFVPACLRLTAADGAVVMRVFDYVNRSLTALDIQNGHCRVHIIVHHSDGRPYLISVNTSLSSGCGAPSIAQRCIGYDSIQLSIDIIDSPNMYERIPAQPQLHSYGSEVYLINNKHGILDGFNNIDVITSLSSFIHIYWNNNFTTIGHVIQPTTDSSNIAAIVTLINDDDEQLTRDIDAINAVNLNGIFVVKQCVHLDVLDLTAEQLMNELSRGDLEADDIP